MVHELEVHELDHELEVHWSHHWPSGLPFALESAQVRILLKPTHAIDIACTIRILTYGHCK